MDTLGVEGRDRCSLKVEGREFLKFTPAIWADSDIHPHSFAHYVLTGGGGEVLEALTEGTSSLARPFARCIVKIYTYLC